MPPKRKYRRDPLKTHVFYAIDTEETFSWCGEVSYSATRDNRTLANILMNSTVVFANTKKVPIGIRAEAHIFMGDGEGRGESIGVIERRKGYISIIVYVPWQVGNFIHMTLLSGNARSIYFDGTEMFRGKGVIHSVTLSKSIEDTWGSIGI